MHIYSLKLFNLKNKKNPILIANAQELSPLPFLIRYSSSTTEMFLFLSRTFILNTEIGKRHGCKEDKYIGWAYIDGENMGGVIITDIEYDRRIAFYVLAKAMESYKSKPINWCWTTIDKDIDISKLDMDIYKLIVEYQDPSNKDNILKINKELNETRVTLHKSIDSLLERGEKIDNLVQKSNDLSHNAKKFYKKSKKMNSWCNSCSIM